MNVDRLHNSSLEALDRRSFFHPFTSIADHQRGEPRIVASAQGVYVTDSKGRRCIDGAAGLWCVNVGYGREEIVEAMARQAHALPFAHSFTGIANEPAILLADRVLQWAPPGMSKVFFGNSGSARPAGQEEDHRPRARLSWRDHRLRQLDGPDLLPRRL
jgi:L-2,4-diaminobutyrate transaminase